MTSRLIEGFFFFPLKTQRIKFKAEKAKSQPGKKHIYELARKLIIFIFYFYSFPFRTVRPRVFKC